MLSVACFFLTVVGLVMMLAPNFWWHLTESWKSNGTEPSDVYVSNTKMGGIVFTVIGVVGFAAMLFL